MRICKICSKEIVDRHIISTTCSELCRKEQKRLSDEKYNNTDRAKLIKKISAKKRYDKIKNTKKYKERIKKDYDKIKNTKKYKKYLADYNKKRKEKDGYEERKKGYMRKYFKTEKGKLTRKKNCYLRRHNKSGKIDFKEIKIKFDKLNNACQLCGILDNITIDHIIPLSKGGKNLTENLQPLCRSCNSIKRDRDWNEVRGLKKWI